MAATHLQQSFVYGEVVNVGLLNLLGSLHGPVLDVGCGAGAWADSLRSAGASPLIGIEPHEAAAERARLGYDLIVGERLEDLDLRALGGEHFGAVIAADVLEHLVDPWEALRRFHRWSRPGATLAVSVPNARYYRVSGGLLLAGRFTYGRSGVMDWTHLRWFTQLSLDRSLRLTGWVPQRWDLAVSGKRMHLGRVLGGRTDPLLASQIRVVAEKAS